MEDVGFRDFGPGDRDWLIAAHVDHYTAEEGFDESFGPMVAGIVDEILTQHDPARERGWVAVRGEERLGTIFCTREDDETARLRLFILVPQARGLGLGKVMIDRCLSFARECGYARMALWTHESHAAACALYAARGFRCTRSEPVRSFGVDLIEQTWEIDLA